jgi:hypothetical protein
VIAVFSHSRARLVLLASHGRGPRGLTPGVSAGKVARRFNLRRVGLGVYRSGRYVFGIRGRRLRYLGVGDASLVRGAGVGGYLSR